MKEQELGLWHYRQLEAGGILVYPRTPIELSDEQYLLILGQRHPEASYHKNIAYRPSEDAITGTARGRDPDQLLRPPFPSLLAVYILLRGIARSSAPHNENGAIG